MNVNLGNNKYKVSEARTEFQKQKGLQNVEKLDENEGMF